MEAGVSVEIGIRPCVAGDATALALVGQATFLETYASVLPAADILHHCVHEHGEAAYAAWLETPGYSLWLAEVAGTGVAVGYVMLCPPDLPVPTRPSDLEIKRIYLLSRFQGGGVGARLMAVALDAAKKAGAERILLGVYGKNTAAIGFYARQGFSVAGERKFTVGANTYDDLVLARGL
jgi:diamine N-acetyltransferase